MSNEQQLLPVEIVRRMREREAGVIVALPAPGQADEGELPAPVRSALTQAILNEDAERLERALEALTESQRDIILLRQFEELTFPEIAARLGKSEDACRMMFARAMTALTLKVSEPRR